MSYFTIIMKKFERKSPKMYKTTLDVAQYLCWLLLLVVGWSNCVLLMFRENSKVPISEVFSILVLPNGGYDFSTWLLFAVTAGICHFAFKRYDWVIYPAAIIFELATTSTAILICYPLVYVLLPVVLCNTVMVSIIAVGQTILVTEFLKYKGRVDILLFPTKPMDVFDECLKDPTAVDKIMNKLRNSHSILLNDEKTLLLANNEIPRGINNRIGHIILHYNSEQRMVRSMFKGFNSDNPYSHFDISNFDVQDDVTRSYSPLSAEQEIPKYTL